MTAIPFASLRLALTAFVDAASACRPSATVPAVIRERYLSEDAYPDIFDHGAIDWDAWVDAVNAAAEQRVEQDWGDQPWIRPIDLRIERGPVGVMDDREAVFLTYGGGRTEARMRIILTGEGADVWARINPETVDRIGADDLVSVGVSLRARTDAIKRHAAPVA